jgi:hypothetical protein
MKYVAIADFLAEIRTQDIEIWITTT